MLAKLFVKFFKYKVVSMVFYRLLGRKLMPLRQHKVLKFIPFILEGLITYLLERKNVGVPTKRTAPHSKINISSKK
jgi:hypothetical protein